MSIVLQLSIGNIVIDLYTKQAPKECTNFINLCKAKYYTFAPIYNIQKGYVAEFGDPLYPLSKDGQSAWSLADKLKPKHFIATKNRLRNNTKGSVAFLTQKDHGGIDEYFTSIVTITLADLDDRRGVLQGVVFGQVVEGLDILEKVNTTIVDETYRPYQDIRVHHTYILEDTCDTIEGLDIPSTPEPSEAQLSTVRLDDLLSINTDEAQELTDEQLQEQKAREANSKALTLEIMGDIPSAEVKPMENVLFVCKLNSITRDDDLEIIFSRFGKIVSCEVVRDKSTGESMQYAFVEYEDKRSCETAYLKMDGVLIDDRRIHVDFSQSVSKLADAWRNTANEKRKRLHGGLGRSGDSNPEGSKDPQSWRSSSQTQGYAEKNRSDRDYERGYYGNVNHRGGQSYEAGSRHSRASRDSRQERGHRDSRDSRSRDADRGYRSNYRSYRDRDKDHRPF